MEELKTIRSKLDENISNDERNELYKTLAKTLMKISNTELYGGTNYTIEESQDGGIVLKLADNKTYTLPSYDMYYQYYDNHTLHLETVEELKKTKIDKNDYGIKYKEKFQEIKKRKDDNNKAFQDLVYKYVKNKVPDPYQLISLNEIQKKTPFTILSDTREDVMKGENIEYSFGDLYKLLKHGPTYNGFNDNKLNKLLTTIYENNIPNKSKRIYDLLDIYLRTPSTKHLEHEVDKIFKDKLDDLVNSGPEKGLGLLKEYEKGVNFDEIMENNYNW